MLKSIPRLFIGLFLLVFLLTGFLVACLYFKTGNINEAFNLKQFSNLKHNEGFLLPDGGGQYALIGYTDVSTDGKSALVIGKILSEEMGPKTLLSALLLRLSPITKYSSSPIL